MGPKPALTLDQIIDAAVAIADAEGVDAVSMQRVASEFGYTKMSMYRYFASKDELIAAMIDRAVGEPPALEREEGWRKPLERWTAALAASWERHEWLPAVTMGDRGMGMNELGWIEQAIATLATTVLTPDEQQALVLLICGHIRSTQSAATAGTQPWSGGRQRELVLTHGDEFQALTRVLGAAESQMSDRGRAFGLGCILDGVEMLLNRRATEPARRSAVKKKR